MTICISGGNLVHSTIEDCCITIASTFQFDPISAQSPSIRLQFTTTTTVAATMRVGVRSNPFNRAVAVVTPPTVQADRGPPESGDAPCPTATSPDRQPNTQEKESTATSQYRTLTKGIVDRLAVDDKEAVFWDRELAGFGLRANPRLPKSTLFRFVALAGRTAGPWDATGMSHPTKPATKLPVSSLGLRPERCPFHSYRSPT